MILKTDKDVKDFIEGWLHDNGYMLKAQYILGTENETAEETEKSYGDEK